MRCTVLLQSVLFSDPYYPNCFYRMYVYMCVCMYVSSALVPEAQMLAAWKEARDTHVQGLFQGAWGFAWAGCTYVCTESHYVRTWVLQSQHPRLA